MSNLLTKDGGFNVQVKSEVEIQDEDAANADLCISLGGDNVFLKTASIIKNQSTGIFGINSNPESHRGKLCNFDIFAKDRESNIKELISNL